MVGCYLFYKDGKRRFYWNDTTQVESIFNNSLQDPILQIFWMVVVVFLGFGICSLGLKNGVEKITKVMMCSLLFIILILVVRAITLPGAGEGLAFYLIPNFEAIQKYGLVEIIFAAMGQAFFTLSLGI
ncbi:MAG: sodium-dependent transporter, partial [Thomasclavelia ramosa]